MKIAEQKHETTQEQVWWLVFVYMLSAIILLLVSSIFMSMSGFFWLYLAIILFLVYFLGYNVLKDLCPA